MGFEKRIAQIKKIGFSCIIELPTCIVKKNFHKKSFFYKIGIELYFSDVKIRKISKNKRNSQNFI